MKSIKVKKEMKSDSSPLPSEKSDEDDKVRTCFRTATSYIEKERGMLYYSLNLKYELRSEIYFYVLKFSFIVQYVVSFTEQYSTHPIEYYIYH